MRKSVPTTMQDVVLVFVTVSGMRGGAWCRKCLRAQDFCRRAAVRPTCSLGHPDHHRRRHLRCG